MTNGVQISIRHAAVAAGLGVLGWMGLVLTPNSVRGTVLASF